MFQDDLEEQITEAVVLTPGEAILFSGWWLLKEGLPLVDVRDVGFCLGILINLVGREAQVEMMVSSFQGVIEPLQMSLWRRELRPGARMPPSNYEDKLDPTAL